jgi:hypothetical protein
VITVSTRGNMDVMVVALVLGAHVRSCSLVRARAGLSTAAVGLVQRSSSAFCAAS